MKSGLLVRGVIGPGEECHPNILAVVVKARIVGPVNGCVVYSVGSAFISIQGR